MYNEVIQKKKMTRNKRRHTKDKVGLQKKTYEWKRIGHKRWIGQGRANVLTFFMHIYYSLIF